MEDEFGSYDHPEWVGLLTMAEIEDIKRQIAKLNDETLLNANDHKYGCDCKECMEFYRTELKR